MQFMQVALKQIVVPSGQQLLVKDVSWQMYENILVIVTPLVQEIGVYQAFGSELSETSVFT